MAKSSTKKLYSVASDSNASENPGTSHGRTMGKSTRTGRRSLKSRTSAGGRRTARASTAGTKNRGSARRSGEERQGKGSYNKQARGPSSARTERRMASRRYGDNPQGYEYEYEIEGKEYPYASERRGYGEQGAGSYYEAPRMRGEYEGRRSASRRGEFSGEYASSPYAEFSTQCPSCGYLFTEEILSPEEAYGYGNIQGEWFGQTPPQSTATGERGEYESFGEGAEDEEDRYYERRGASGRR